MFSAWICHCSIPQRWRRADCMHRSPPCPCQAGVPGLTTLTFFAAVCIIPRLHLKSLLCISTLLPNPLLSSAQHTHHSVLDALSTCLVIPMRSFAHLNCLLHGEQLFTSSVLNSTRWLFFCAPSSSKVPKSSSSPRFMLARPARGFPPIRASWRCVRFFCKTK